MNIKLIKMALLSAFIYVLAGCDGVNLSDFKIAYPINEAAYIGHTGNEPAANGSGTEPLGEFKITFTQALSTLPRITLNGHQVSDKFTFSSTEAVADAVNLKQFLRQGNNTFAVERAAFGPAVNFYYDGMGPTVVVASADIDAGTKMLQLKGHLRDYSELASNMTLKLDQVTGYTAGNALIRDTKQTVSVAVNAADGKFDQNIDLSLVYGLDKPYVYSFEACDKYGYCTEAEFIADNEGSEALTMKNAVVVALGETFVQTLKPLMSSTVKTTLDAAPIDARCLKVQGQSPGSANEGDPGQAVNSTAWENGGKKGRDTDPLFSKKYACGDWDDRLICGEKRGVIEPGKNITAEEFEAYKAENPTANIADAMFTCDKNADPNTSYFVPSDDPAKDGAKLANLNPFKVRLAGTDYAGYMQHMSFYDGDYANRGLLDGLVTSSTPQGSVIMNQFEVLEDNKVHVNLVMTQMFVRIEMTQGYNFMCGFWEQPYNVEFPAISLLMPKLAIDGDITINKETNGELSIQMADNASVSFVEDPKFQDLNIQCGALPLNLGGLVDALSGLIKDLIGGMVPGIINQVFADNLNKLRFGGAMMQPDNSTAFTAFLAIQALGTDSSALSPSVYDLTTSLDSTVKVTEPDQNAPTMLGPKFVADPIDPNAVFNATSGGASNISVAVNSNMVNSMLAALHSTGVTYLTSYKGKTYYGANPNTPAENQANQNSPTLSTVKKGDTRMRLWPDMPPTIVFEKTQKAEAQSRATIHYEAATLYQDEYDGSSWDNKIKMQVHFNLGVEINNDNNGNFTMGAAGPPQFVIDDYENKTAIQIPKSMLQALVDAAMALGGDILADQKITFDFNKIITDQLNGQTVEYYSSEDNYGLAEGECLQVTGINQSTGEVELTPPAGATNGSDGKPDLVCYDFKFDVATYTAGTTGANNGNLFFQMKLSDQRLPPPYAIPRLDLDGDSKLDYRDNCSLPLKDLTAAVQAEYGGDMTQVVDEDGSPKPGVINNLRARLHTMYSDPSRYGALTQAEKDWYNQRRAQDGDTAVLANNWVDVLFNNPSQAATVNSTGNLCLPDVDKDSVIDFVDNCPGVFNPDQEVDGTPKANYEEGDIGDACNVRKTFVMIRSLGSKVDTGTYQCLSHEHYKVNAGTTGGITHSATIRTSNGAFVKDCDSADLNQRWYLEKMAGEQAKLSGLPSNAQATANAGVYHLFADSSKNNSNSWQLVAQVSGNGELRMAKMNDPNREHSTSNSGDLTAGWVLDIDPTSLSSNGEDERKQPWIIRSWNLDALTTACLFYNNDGWGPDINSDQCATTYMGIGNGGVADLWFRWGIYIGGTKQLWDSTYPQ